MLRPTMTVGALVRRLQDMDQSSPIYVWQNGLALPVDTDVVQVDHRCNLDDGEDIYAGNAVVIDLDDLIPVHNSC